MTLTPSEVASITSSLSGWETAEYICAGLVTVGCVGEYVADFTKWLTGGDKERKERLAKISTLVLITALSLELICLVRTNELSGMVIGSLNDKAVEASAKARQALADSSAASAQSMDAKNTSGKAIEESDKANTSASGALTTARAARQETEMFGRDVTSAKGQVADLESSLTKALQRTSILESQLEWRTVSSLQAAKIRAEMPLSLKGMKVTASSLVSDSEGSQYVAEISQALKDAGVIVDGPNVVLLTGPLPQGVFIRVGNDATLPNSAAAQLQNVLKTSGIDAAGAILKDVAGGYIDILVGIKPRPAGVKK